MTRATVTIETQSGRCEASIFRPQGSPGPWPAVILFMDGIGIRPALFEMGERLASHGYYVLLPDLFYRAGPYTAPDPRALFSDPELRQAWVSKYIMSATPENAREDTRAFLDFLAAQPDVLQPKVGTTGYCMSGKFSIAAAGNFPDRVAAAASYHGGRFPADAVDNPYELASRIKARVYIAGAPEDHPDGVKERLEEAFSKAGVEHKVETYDGVRHGWVPSDTPVHDKAAAERHWQTLFDLFDATLKE